VGEVGEIYSYYDPKESGQTNWISLKIHTKPIDGIRISCGVCKMAMGIKPVARECGHAFHGECLAKLKGMSSDVCVLCCLVSRY